MEFRHASERLVGGASPVAAAAVAWRRRGAPWWPTRAVRTATGAVRGVAVGQVSLDVPAPSRRNGHHLQLWRLQRRRQPAVDVTT